MAASSEGCALSATVTACPAAWSAAANDCRVIQPSDVASTRNMIGQPGDNTQYIACRIAADCINMLVSIEVELDRLPGLRLAASNDYAHEPGFVLRALTRLDIEWD